MSNGRRKLITEELPSTGVASHTHQWQRVVDEESEKEGMVLFVCGAETCPATKKVPSPIKVESQAEGSKLLMEDENG